MKQWTGGRALLPTMGVLGFLEASFVPLPIESLFIPIMAANAKRVWAVALCLLAGNLVAAALVYWVSANFAQVAIEPLAAALNLDEMLAAATSNLRARGFIALVLVDLTPIPFQLSMAAAGAAQFPLGAFFLAVAVSRGARWFAMAALIYVIGARAQAWLDRHQLSIFLWGFALFLVLSLLMFL